ncbi:MAG TPA: hypothetical protein VM911_04805 [Pyrinomonadaceae bacterium]|jgi:hypothetical protein|nr:hypothetical protein [Pyrinomonadaceae bacterium]
MKIILANILLLLSLSQVPFSQNGSTSQLGYSLIDKSRDPLFITYERLDDPDPKREGIERDRVLVRLHNNSTCVVLIETMEAEKFYLPLPPNPTITDRVKRGINYDLPDGAIVPAMKYYTQDNRRSKTPEAAWGGDMFFTFRLLGGNSLLFAIPTAYLRKGNDIVVPFDYGWEKEGERPSPIYSGDVEHRVYFYGDSMPDEVKRKIGRR